MELIEKRPSSDWRKWTSTRRGTFTIATICAVIAAVILAVALSNRNGSSTAGRSATVLVATKLIEQGTAGDAIGVERLYRVQKVTQRQVTAGAFAEPAALHGQVAAADIYPGQQLTSSDFIDGGNLESRLASTQRAVAVPVDTSHGGIGEIQTGDHVDVYSSFPEQSGRPAELRLLAPNVTVLKAAQLSSGGLGSNNQITASANVVLEVNDRQAAKLAFTADNGKVWLTLRPGAGAAPKSEVVSEASILSE
jgi:Flp pilus assembly protein CpaB